MKQSKDYFSKNLYISKLTLAMLLLAGVSMFSFAQAKDSKDSQATMKTAKESISCMINNQGIDKVRLGMPYSDIKKAYPKAIIEQTSDGEGISYMAIYLSQTAKNNSDSFIDVFFANEPAEGKTPNPDEKVMNIQTGSKLCKTKEGVAPGALLKNVANTYGGLKNIMVTEIEAREFATFVNAPDYLHFQIMAGDGILPKGKSTGDTKKYRPTARIASISVIPTK